MKKLMTICAVVTMILSVSGTVNATSIYNNIPSTLAGSYYSVAYLTTQTSQFGDRITFGGTARELESATFTMVDWAKQSVYDPTGATPGGFYHDFTLNLYEAGTGYSHGALITSVTQTHFVPYRPEVWSFNGYAFNMTFDLSNLDIIVPDSIVYGLAFNTSTYGSAPMGATGPYDVLNFGLSTDTNGGITVGSTDLDQVFWHTATANLYTDDGLNGVNTFRMDSGWPAYVPMANFTAIPEPATIALLGLGGLSLIRRKRNA